MIWQNGRFRDGKQIRDETRRGRKTETERRGERISLKEKSETKSEKKN